MDRFFNWQSAWWKRRRAMLKFGRSVCPRAIRHWIGKEIGFTVLPVVVVLVLILFFKGRIATFWLAPEWSFAAVVLLGSSIDHLSELREQGALLPYKMNFLSKILLLLLILSVVTFALASSSDRFGQNLSVSEQVLMWSQLALFTIAAFLSFILELVTLAAEEEREHFPPWMSSYRFYKHLKGSLDSTKKNIRYAAIAMRERKNTGSVSADPVMRSEIWLEMKTQEIESELDCIEKLLQRARSEFDSLRQSEEDRVSAKSRDSE